MNGLLEREESVVSTYTTHDVRYVHKFHAKVRLTCDDMLEPIAALLESETCVRVLRVMQTAIKFV